MANTKRQHEIIRLLQIKNIMRVSDIADHLKVTQTSIRRDLMQLEQDNVISRSHGQAKLTYFQEAQKLSVRYELNIQEKKEIARAAYQLIKPNDSVILDSGTSTLALAEVLSQKPLPLSLITNSIPVATALASEQKMHITVSGGLLHPETMSLLGPDCDTFYEKIVADTAFIGSTGIHPIAGLTSSSPFQVSLKRKIIQSASKVIALVDSSKFLSSGINIFCGFDRLFCIITSKTKENKAILANLKEKGVKIILV
ncbi:MAG: DeoR/GlpR family DNA-binding transcription regulator [Treponemataceae bacterium]